MAQEQEGMERTEEATPKRLEDARKKGQVPRSKELNTVMSLIGAAMAMLILGPVLMAGLKEMLISSLAFDHARAYDSAALLSELGRNARKVALLLSPILLLMTVVTLFSPMALGGVLFTGSNLAPKFERINPLKGLGRMFSPRSLLELGKAVIKVTMVALVVAFVFRLELKEITMLSMQQLETSMFQTGSMLVNCFIGFSAVLIIVVMIDVPYQLWDHKQKLMMTKQEIRDEMKDTEGKPEVKQAIRARQQEIAQRRMMEEVPKADVIITNPTHYSVAIKYDQEGSGAPIVVAKGKDHVAFKIREIAREHGIAIFSAPPLARALYGSTDLNEEIPENLFVAVAQVLAYIFQLRQAAQGLARIPQAPGNISVPDEYRRKELH